MPNYFDYPSIFVDAGEIFVMTDDVVTPSNPPVAPIEKEEFEKAPLNEALFDMNVSQWLHE